MIRATLNIAHLADPSGDPCSHCLVARVTDRFRRPLAGCVVDLDLVGEGDLASTGTPHASIRTDRDGDAIDAWRHRALPARGRILAACADPAAARCDLELVEMMAPTVGASQDRPAL